MPDPAWPPAPEGWPFWLTRPQPVPPVWPTPQTAARSAPVAPPPTAATPSPASTSVPPSLRSDAPATPNWKEQDEHIVGEAVTLALIRQELASARAEIASLEAKLAASATQPVAHSGAVASSDDPIELSDQQVLQDVGIYRYHHPLENAVDYQDQLASVDTQIRDLVVAGEAVLASDHFTFNNSLARGRKMTADFSKLMFRAFNAEAENCARTLRAGALVTAQKRLDRTAQSIERLGAMMEMRINPEYLRLRHLELELTADFRMKQQEEREDAKEERARLREEKKVEAELVAQRERLDKERRHYENALAAAEAAGDTSVEALDALRENLARVDDAIEENDYRAANIRAGYVYVISNPGSYGQGVVKIGMTRRLEPMDRVRELGGASVPFPFDVHALFFSEDAVSLETMLHQRFAARRVNLVNLRREFFFATPAEVRDAMAGEFDNLLLEFNETPEAEQYHQSRGQWPSGASAQTA